MPGHAQNLGFPRRRPRASFEGPEYLVKTTIPCEQEGTTFPEATAWGLTVTWSVGESEAPNLTGQRMGGARQRVGELHDD